jgi:Zn-finger nucleic acid-binding protein
MNCHNCGAAMELVESRRYFRCRHCGSYHFPTTVESDGIRVSGTPAGAPGCPVCDKPMAHAVLDDEHAVDFCTTCRGVLLPRAAFATVTNKRRAWATTPPAEPTPLDRRELRRALVCPKCRGRFETYPHLGPGSVVIDNCTRCDLIWLDFGELRQIENAPGSDRGSKHVPRIDDAYVREGLSPREKDDDDDDWIRMQRRANSFALLFNVIDD